MNFQQIRIQGEKHALLKNPNLENVCLHILVRKQTNYENQNCEIVFIYKYQ
jgi:hypothetical protein